MVQSLKLKKILVTGSSSRFCKYLKEDLKHYNVFFYLKKKNFNILDFKKWKIFKKIKK